MSGYAQTAARMDALAAQQPGYLGVESAREEIGITVSCWRSAQDAPAWKAIAEHQLAQRLGRAQWYRTYRVRIATVDRRLRLHRDAVAPADGSATAALRLTAVRPVLLRQGSPLKRRECSSHEGGGYTRQHKNRSRRQGPPTRAIRQRCASARPRRSGVVTGHGGCPPLPRLRESPVCLLPADPRRLASAPGSRSRGRAATLVDADLAAGPDELGN